LYRNFLELQKKGTIYCIPTSESGFFPRNTRYTMGYTKIVLNFELWFYAFSCKMITEN